MVVSKQRMTVKIKVETSSGRSCVFWGFGKHFSKKDSNSKSRNTLSALILLKELESGGTRRVRLFGVVSRL